MIIGKILIEINKLNIINNNELYTYVYYTYILNHKMSMEIHINIIIMI